MSLLEGNVNTLLFVFLMSFRVGAFFMSMPIVSDFRMPIVVKVILPIAIAALLAPAVAPQLAPDLASNTMTFLFAILTEVLAGLLMGFSIHILFVIANFAGELAGAEIGFSIASMFDPSLGQASAIAFLMRLLLVLLFFTTDMHHKFIWVLVQSYQNVPPGTHFFPLTQAIMGFVELFRNVILLAVHFTLPIIVTIFLSHVMAGILTITAPQMNVYFNVSVTMNIMIGMAIVAFTIGMLFNFFQKGSIHLQDFLTRYFAYI